MGPDLGCAEGHGRLDQESPPGIQKSRRNKANSKFYISSAFWEAEGRKLLVPISRL